MWTRYSHFPTRFLSHVKTKTTEQYGWWNLWLFSLFQGSFCNLRTRGLCVSDVFSIWLSPRQAEDKRSVSVWGKNATERQKKCTGTCQEFLLVIELKGFLLKMELRMLAVYPALVKTGTPPQPTSISSGQGWLADMPVTQSDLPLFQKTCADGSSALPAAPAASWNWSSNNFFPPSACLFQI